MQSQALCQGQGVTVRVTALVTLPHLAVRVTVTFFVEIWLVEHNKSASQQSQRYREQSGIAAVG